MGNQPPDTKATNHSSATNFPQHVDKFIRTELEHQAIMGSFEHSPFSPWYRTNPLMTRPKRDSQDRRVILDLSYPEGASVNAQIPCQSLLNATFKLRLPTPKQLADRIMTLGPGCHLFKIDHSRAYRQLRSDPRDWPFLGISWVGGQYVDAGTGPQPAKACQKPSQPSHSTNARLSLCHKWTTPRIPAYHTSLRLTIRAPLRQWTSWACRWPRQSVRCPRQKWSGSV